MRGLRWFTYWDLLLGQNYGAVLAFDANGHDVGGSDSLECILCGFLAMFLPLFNAEMRRIEFCSYTAVPRVGEAYQLGTGVPGPRRW